MIRLLKVKKIKILNQRVQKFNRDMILKNLIYMLDCKI